MLWLKWGWIFYNTSKQNIINLMKNTVLQTNWNFIISKIPNQSCSHELNSVTKIFVRFVITVKGLEPATPATSYTCKRPGCYHSNSKTHVRDMIFQLSPIHGSVIYQICWIQLILFNLGKTPLSTPDAKIILHKVRLNIQKTGIWKFYGFSHVQFNLMWKR